MGAKDPQTGPPAQFGAFCPVWEPSAQFWGLRPQGGINTQTYKQTDKHFVSIYEYDEVQLAKEEMITEAFYINEILTNKMLVHGNH